MARDMTSPFRPGYPVAPEFFVGRQQELRTLREKLGKALSGRMEVAFVCGERGMGKSSLAALLRELAEKDERALGVHAFMGGAESVEDVVRRLFDRLAKDSNGKGWWTSVKDFLGDHVRQVGIFDITVEFSPTADQIGSLVNDFPAAISGLMKRLAKQEVRGLLLVLDDINGIATSDRFANWLKSFVDHASVSKEPLPVMLLLVGLNERREEMIAAQPSLARILHPVEIALLSDLEARGFLQKSFASVGITVDEAALEALASYSGGLPVLVHELGDAAFYRSTDGKLTFDQAIDAVIAAADVVGRKLLQPQVFRELRSKKYRSILRHIAKQGSSSNQKFTRSELLKGLTKEQRAVVDNFLRKMQSLGVIAKDHEEGPGAYRFTNKLFRLYFFMEAKASEAAK